MGDLKIVWNASGDPDLQGLFSGLSSNNLSSVFHALSWSSFAFLLALATLGTLLTGLSPGIYGSLFLLLPGAKCLLGQLLASLKAAVPWSGLVP